MLQLGLIQIQQQQGASMMMLPPTGKLISCGVLRLATSPRTSRGTSILCPVKTRCMSSDELRVEPVHSPRPLPWLFVGIGNPGSKFDGTRHNVGFQMIDTIAKAENISLSTIQFKSLMGKGQIGGAPVLLAKPQTYMNLSGEAVKPLASYYKIPPERVLTIFDDMDLEFAVMRLLSKGGHGGHNGMKSILQHLGTQSTARLRIGIGRPPGSMDGKAFVLQKFNAGEKEELEYALGRALEAVRLITSHGLERAISTWNQVRKSKSAKMVYSDLRVDE